MNDAIHRRSFLAASGLAVAGVLGAGLARALPPHPAAEGLALGFIQSFSDRWRPCLDRENRWLVEVRDVARLGSAFHAAAELGIARLHVAGSRVTFQIEGRDFEFESLCPAAFAEQPA